MSSAFNHCAEDYQQYRPEYPPALFDDLVAAFALGPGACVVDVGTGTGRAAIPWAERRLRVIGIDPSPAMLDQGRALAAERRLQNVEFRLGAAETTGLPDGAADAVAVAQAFHWMDPDTALVEFQRILKPGGGLAVFWNNRDLSEPHLREMEQLILRYNPQHRLEYRTKPWGEILAGRGRFRDVRYKQYRHTSEVPTEAVVGLTRTFSYVRNVLSDTAMAAFENDLRALLAPYERGGRVRLPYLTDVWYAKAVTSDE